MPVTGSHDLSHGTPLLVPLHSTSACNRPPLRLTSHARSSSYAISSGACRTLPDPVSNRSGGRSARRECARAVAVAVRGPRPSRLFSVGSIPV
eukprot:5657545-Prymnesium_polylepis.1